MTAPEDMPSRPSPITFYRSSLCPRCMLVRRELDRLRQEYPGLEVEEVDVVVHPLRAWRSGVRMIPALQAGDELLTGIILEAQDIRRLVARHLTVAP
ncbi:MAG: hypothetical protein ACYC9M_08745 [Desulfobulbaceae bacterium]